MFHLFWSPRCHSNIKWFIYLNILMIRFLQWILYFSTFLKYPEHNLIFTLLYYFSRPGITKYHKLGTWTTECIGSEIKMFTGLVSFEGCKTESVPFLLSNFWWFTGSLVFHGLWKSLLDLRLHLFIVPVCMSVSKSTLLIRTQLYWIMSPSYIIIPAMTLFPNKVTFWCNRGMNFEGMQFNP